ncbi:hypothetical protein AgCh_024465 [Apium graveolens]
MNTVCVDFEVGVVDALAEVSVGGEELLDYGGVDCLCFWKRRGNWNNNCYRSNLLKYKECKDTTIRKMIRKDVGVKFNFLDKDNYHHWKVKMHLHLLSQDEAYVDCIERGPHVPMRAATGNKPSVPKPRHEWSDPDIEQGRKDKKAMNILFNGVDGDILNNIIN